MCDDDKELLLSCWFVQAFTGLIYDTFQLVAMCRPRLYFSSFIYLNSLSLRKRFRQTNIHHGLFG